MLCWCRLEDALEETSRAAAGKKSWKVNGTFNDRVIALEACLKARFPGDADVARAISDLMPRIDLVRRRRNLIVHGLAGVNADPAKGEPHIICMEGEQGHRRPVKITQTELTMLLEDINRRTHDLESIKFLTRRSTTRR
jgi:hypothetical protein